MKLRQMASGFFMQKTDEGTENRIIIDIHKAKINEVHSIINEVPDEQIIIWCQFQHEIELLEKELSVYGTTVTAYGKTKHLEENIDDFKNGRAKFIIAHPKTLKYGVTFTNCKYAIYYSFSYSAEDYDQSHDRNYRLGQTESCTYFFLQAADTIDEIMYDKVMNKLTNAEFFEQLVKDAAKHGIDYASLKPVSDEKIREELTHRDGLSSIQDQIVMRSEEREHRRLFEEKKTVLPTDRENIDFFDVLSEPTEEELFELECELAREEKNIHPLSWYLKKDGKSDIHNDVFSPDWINSYLDFPSDRYASDKMLSSFLRCCGDNYDIDEVPIDFSYYRLYEDLFGDNEDNDLPVNFEDEPEELQNLMREHPTKEVWIAEMYRRVYHALQNLPEHIAEMLRLKYGLNDGIWRNNVTIGDIVWSYYDEDDDRECRCTAPRVSAGITQGLELLAENYTLQSLREQVINVFGVN